MNGSRTSSWVAEDSLSTQTVHAIVLRRRDAGESDRRLTLLTQELGVIDALAKGARKSGSRLAGSSEPMTACILGLAAGKGKGTRYVTQAQPISSFPKLRSDFDRLSFGLALCELASAVLPHEAPADESFAFMVKSLTYLEVHESPLVCLIWAQTKLMEIAGFKPEFSRCVVTGRKVELAREWVSPHAGGMVDEAATARYTDRFKVRAEALFGGSRIVDLDEPPRSLKFAEEVFLAIFPFWLAMADQPLPANAQVANVLRESQGAE